MHLPFIGQGYGREEDAWAQVLNAQKIWETGVYEVSRLPGHPLYELLLSALWPLHSPVFFNLLSTIATAGAVVIFYQITHRLKPQQSFFALHGIPICTGCICSRSIYD
ncbi:MAG: hypothetical protein U5L96_05675 [Owenweeksia sp.]|nr:hypothetical protein [Owenweeksia sp.]